MNIFEEFLEIVKQLENENIKYALVGGVAMAFHAEPRFTKDIDILISPDDIKKVKTVLEKMDYFESAPPWMFQKTEITLHRFVKVLQGEEMMIDVLLAGSKHHYEIIEEAVEAESEEGDGKVKVAARDDLIWLKKNRNSKQDKADIERLENEKN